MIFKRFGESIDEPVKQWYELANGEHVECDEETINILWCNWVVGFNAKRADTKKETIFEFINPVELNLRTAERW